MNPFKALLKLLCNRSPAAAPGTAIYAALRTAIYQEAGEMRAEAVKTLDELTNLTFTNYTFTNVSGDGIQPATSPDQRPQVMATREEWLRLQQPDQERILAAYAQAWQLELHEQAQARIDAQQASPSGGEFRSFTGNFNFGRIRIDGYGGGIITRADIMVPAAGPALPITPPPAPSWQFTEQRPVRKLLKRAPELPQP